MHLIKKIRKDFEILSEPNFNCILLNMFSDFLKLCLSLNSIASDWIYSKICPKCFKVEIQFFLIDVILRLFPKLCELNFNCRFLKSSQTFPICVLAETQLHLIENTLRWFQIFSWAKFKSTLSKKFWGFSQLCLTRNSIASYWKYSETISECVVAENQLHPIEKILRRFLLCLNQNSIACFWKSYMKFPKSVLSRIQLPLIEIIPR